MKKSPPNKLVIAVGTRFGKLTVLAELPSRKWKRFFRCLCDCGNTSSVILGNLRNRTTTSCGCWRKIRPITHGHSIDRRHTPEYSAWHAMIQRCYSLKETNRHYARYQGRGITVCAQWRNSFEVFLLDMGLRPSSKHSIDRINNDGNYEPGNCRWATRYIQDRNRAPTALKKICVNGHDLSVSGRFWGDGTRRQCSLCLRDWKRKRRNELRQQVSTPSFRPA